MVVAIVNQDGYGVDEIVRSRRNTKVAKRLLTRHGLFGTVIGDGRIR